MCYLKRKWFFLQLIVKMHAGLALTWNKYWTSTTWSCVLWCQLRCRYIFLALSIFLISCVRYQPLMIVVYACCCWTIKEGRSSSQHLVKDIKEKAEGKINRWTTLQGWSSIYSLDCNLMHELDELVPSFLYIVIFQLDLCIFQQPRYLFSE
jgi:hypothetical protein